MNHCVFAPDGKSGAVVLNDGSLWRVELPGKEMTCLHTNIAPTARVGISNDGTWLTCVDEQQVQVWDFPRLRLALTLPGVANAWTLVKFSGDGDSFASGTSDGWVRVYGTRSGRQLLALKAHRDAVLDVALSSNGRWLASASDDATVNLIEVAGQGTPVQLAGARLSYWSVAFSPDSRRLAAGTGEGSIKIWDLVSLREVATLRCGSQPIKQLAFHPDGDVLVCSTSDGGPWTIRFWRAAPLAEVDRSTAP